MGCGISKFNLVDEGMTSCGGLRPLRRKMDEVRGMDRATADVGTASTKLLLKDDVTEAGVESNHGCKSVSRDSLPAKEPPAIHQIVTGPNEGGNEEKEERGLEAQRKGERKNHDGNICNDNKGERKKKKTKQHGKNDDSDDDDDSGRRISNFDDSSWMGSPSFREYCVPNPDSNQDDDGGIDGGNDDGKDDRTADGRKRCKNSQESVNFVCRDEICVRPSSIVSPTPDTSTEVKKESKGRRFIKVFPRHMPMNFWNTRNNVNATSPELPQKLM